MAIFPDLHAEKEMEGGSIFPEQVLECPTSDRDNSVLGFSGANIVGLLHEEESFHPIDSALGTQLSVSESLRCDSERQALEMGGSVNNVLSLVNWNVGPNESDEVCFPDLDILPLRRNFPSSSGLCCEASTSKVRRRCGDKKHASLGNIMDQGAPSQIECSIHDSDIENRNQVILRSTEQVVQQCNELTIFFFEEREDVMASAIRILRK